MRTPGSDHPAASPPRAAPPAALVRAFGALARLPAGLRPLPCAPGPRILPADVLDAWTRGVRDALRTAPALHVGVADGELAFGDTPADDPDLTALASRLAAAGLRALTLLAGASEAELERLAGLLAAAWGEQDATFAAAAWEEALPHAWFDLAPAEAPERSPPRVSAAAARLRALPAPFARCGPVSTDAASSLLDLRATVAPEPAGLLEASATAAIGPELAAELALLDEGLDLPPATLAAVAGAALGAARTREEAGRAAAALRALIVALFGAADIGPLLHRGLAAVDPDLTDVAALREAAAEAFAALAASPARERLAARVPDTDAGELRGALFSLFLLLDREADLVALAGALPRWATAILADTALLRMPTDGSARVDEVRQRLDAAEPTTVRFGLAMAARLDDARLIDAVAGCTAHASAEVRRAALVALRPQGGARVREVVLRRLDDPVPEVRREALRYAALHGLSLPEAR